ncbi:hypothetical protein [Clostridium saccharobutylicum]|uniref:hypothetical protein n=1 Tax=Clostridium saccharobutylicum TaxID=169679 RepID=UPI0011820600|nr:hypothetical protein [Clostridium saccharobutylicum]MBC2437787.1 hypothetical protein [Clostridium saccharobutylicum]MBC2464533.1 hypothetical protein [Clostridium saccharobutylicum]MBC2468764.1 hypothetical protein [Clostridium saccharobutylicum]MBC2482527.1 hypothetical protein [Clostridium saccharobutylicum]MBC2508551.1 hypothetical protein [Clostridium saccharobutylicum]
MDFRGSFSLYEISNVDTVPNNSVTASKVTTKSSNLKNGIVAIIIKLIFFGGLGYLIIRFIRKLKK